MTTDAAPADIDAEQALLSCMLHSPAALTWAIGNLDADDLYRPSHRQLFAILREMLLAGEHVDTITAAARIRTAGLLGDLDLVWLSDIDAAAPLTEAYPLYGQIVTRMARTRRILDEARKLTALAQDPTIDHEAVAARAAVDLAALVMPPEHAELTGPALVADLEAAIDLAASDSLTTWGLAALDRKTRGLFPGRLVLVAARPSVGKSSLAIQLAERVAHDDPVLFWSYEMDSWEVTAKAIAAARHVPLSRVLAQSGESDLRVVQGLMAINTLPLTVCVDNPDLAGLVARTTAAHARRRLGLVVVDYLQLVTVARDSRARTREQEVAEVARTLKLLARRLQVPVVACAQLSREADGRKPRLSDLRESGALEQDADQVVFLHKEQLTDQVVEVEVAKNRMGMTGPLRLAWRPEETAFANLDVSHAQEVR